MFTRLSSVFASLNAHDVRYLVIGGVALNAHGVQRATYDVDILIQATIPNARRLLSALVEAGIGTADLTTPEDLLSHEITILRDFVRIDIQTSTPGVTFENAWDRRAKGRVDEQEFFMLSKSDLIASKRAAG